MTNVQRAYLNPKGRWEVTTEGDEEGRTTRHLGTHDGYVDEIALHFADKQGYALRFERRAEAINFEPTRANVIVSFGYDAGLDSLQSQQRANFVADVFQDRPVRISQANIYGAVQIVAGKTQREHEAIVKMAVVGRVLSKLSPEDVAILEAHFSK